MNWKIALSTLVLVFTTVCATLSVHAAPNSSSSQSDRPDWAEQAFRPKR